jgi:type VI secretion system secreted protein VgrG
MSLAITVSKLFEDAGLRLHALTARQGLSSLEEIELELLGLTPDVAPEDLLGKACGVDIGGAGERQRHFNGIVMRFGLGRMIGGQHSYRVSVRPRLWLLTRTTDCRVFQDMTVPAIVEQVLGDNGETDYKLKLYRSYRTRNYCVQYRETDFNFIARLLEDEGIYWYFEHGPGEHRLVLVDDLNAHELAPGCDDLPFFETLHGKGAQAEHIGQWDFSREVQTGKVTLTSYDFKRPLVSLEVDATLQREHEVADFEQFDFQGDYTQLQDGRKLAHDRIEEAQARHERLSGRSNAQGLAVGFQFAMSRHPRADQNQKYLCTQTRISVQSAGHEAGSGGAGGAYHCSFEALPASHAFRAVRRTPKPFVQGPQTAVVVGPGGEEIYTDTYGRVKVQFHWDRYGKKDEKSSCWVRVSSPWAGKSFGFIQVPRMGQEVVVDFLEGDPDQPLITGRVYNAEQMPPWALPANATQSGVLTRSSKGGAYGTANALRFEDKKGSEQLWLHAEKNQDIEVENDETHWVGHDRTKTIDHDEKVHVKHDRTETVDNDETITIHHDRKERVDNDETIEIGRDRFMTIDRDKTEKVIRNKTITVLGRHSETIAQTMEVNVGASLSETVAVNYSETVGAAMELTVGGALAITVGGVLTQSVGGAMAVTVGGNISETVGNNKTVSTGGSVTEKVGSNKTTDVATDFKETVGGQHVLTVAKEHVVKAKKIQFEAEDELSIKVGSAEMIFKKNGDILISGGKINVKGSGDVVIKGSKIAEN